MARKIIFAFLSGTLLAVLNTTAQDIAPEYPNPDIPKPEIIRLPPARLNPAIMPGFGQPIRVNVMKGKYSENRPWGMDPERWGAKYVKANHLDNVPLRPDPSICKTPPEYKTYPDNYPIHMKNPASHDIYRAEYQFSNGRGVSFRVERTYIGGSMRTFYYLGGF